MDGTACDETTDTVAQMQATLYCAARATRRIPMEALDTLKLAEDELLWVHLGASEDAVVQRVLDALSAPRAALDLLCQRDGTPTLRSFEDWFAVQVVGVATGDTATPCGEVLAVLCGPNVVVSTTRGSIPWVESLRQEGARNLDIGILTGDSFVVTLLEAQLTTYFDAASRLEAHVERLEVTILASTPSSCMERLRELRQSSSRLRRMLAAHRVVFGGMARPDFRPRQTRRTAANFHNLEMHYERAMDMVEHGRELVVGTFELFTIRATMKTNDTMRVLTFVTVLFGALAVIAGALGMNFETSFFRSGAVGFWIAVAAMIGIVLGGVWLARLRGWL